MLSCKQVSTLVSEALEHKLPWWQQLNLWLHLSMCRLCWGFRRDVVQLHEKTREGARQIEFGAANSSEITLSEESRERIKKLLEG